MGVPVIVDAVRTPVGRRGGGLSAVHPADLGAHVLRALFDRVAIDPVLVDDVIFGCVDTIGPQAGDIARTCWLAAIGSSRPAASCSRSGSPGHDSGGKSAHRSRFPTRRSVNPSRWSNRPPLLLRPQPRSYSCTHSLSASPIPEACSEPLEETGDLRGHCARRPHGLLGDLTLL